MNRAIRVSTEFEDEAAERDFLRRARRAHARFLKLRSDERRYVAMTNERRRSGLLLFGREGR